MGQIQNGRCFGNGGKRITKKFDFTAIVGFFEVSVVT